MPEMIDKLNSIPWLGPRRSSPSSIYSCVTDEHLHGYTPVAGALIDEPMSRWNANYGTKRYQKGERYLAARRKFIDVYLLVEKNGEFYVDKFAVADHRGYGLREDLPKLTDMLLPSACFDFFKHMAERHNMTKE